MRKLLLSTTLLVLYTALAQGQRAVSAANWQQHCVDLKFDDASGQLLFGRIPEHRYVAAAEFPRWFALNSAWGEQDGLKLIGEFRDDLGMLHYRYQQMHEGKEVYAAQVISHTIEGRVVSFNGRWHEGGFPAGTATLDEPNALNKAFEHVGAESYKWQIPEEEAEYRIIKDDPHATYAPKGRLVWLPERFAPGSGSLKLVWLFDIYAHEPMSRQNLFIDAQTGAVLETENLIHAGDSKGVAKTRYSDTQRIVTDSLSKTSYRLRETGRGGGVETFNMRKGTNYGTAVDFTDTDNFWNNTNTNWDEVATDAHWGAEKTFDFFKVMFNRNSFDNNNAKIRSYVHYSANYANAFWNGSVMTYGDGSTSSSLKVPLTALDVCGHEIAHAVTTYSAGLIYSYESGALNESFSDVFGNAIERWARSKKWNWRIGEDITSTGNGIRNMANPNNFNHPDCYKGSFWWTSAGDNGGVHVNSGVQNYWYYLLSDGGSGKNDLGKNFNVDSIGFLKAARIAYRNLTVYLTPSSQYADARTYGIMSAADLYGNCSKEVISTTNAWYAVGIGNVYDSGFVKADFVSDTFFCRTPAKVDFINTSANARSAEWWFGDGNMSNIYYPANTYQNYGSYSVKLKVLSCFKNRYDSITKTAWIRVDSTLDICQGIVMPASGRDTAQACRGIVYDQGGEGNYFQNNTSILHLTDPGADSMIVQFTMVNLEQKYDTIYLYSGWKFTGATPWKTTTGLMNGGLPIRIPGNTVTFKFWSDQLVVGKGFKAKYYSVRKPLKVNAGNDTTLCYGDSMQLKAGFSGGHAPDLRVTWKGWPSGVSPIVKPADTTTYTVTLFDLCSGLSVSDQVKLSVLKPLSVQVMKDSVICSGTSAILRATVSGGMAASRKLTWNPGNLNGTLVAVKPGATTLYQAVLSDGCTDRQDTAQVNIWVKPALKVTVKTADTLLCRADSVRLSASASGGDTINYQYSWNRGLGLGATQKTKPASDGWYKVSLSDGCSVPATADSVYVRFRPLLKVTLDPDTLICEGRKVFLRSNPSGGIGTKHELIWDQGLPPGNKTQTVAPKTTTMYRVTLSDGCMDPVTDSAKVTVRLPLQLTLNRDTQICYGAPLTLNAGLAGGLPSGYNLTWNQGLGSGTAHNVSPLSNTTYVAILKDGCTVTPDTAQVNVTVRAKLAATPVYKNLVCPGDSVQVNLVLSGGLPLARSITWMGSIYNAQNPFKFKPIASGFFHYSVSDNCSRTLNDSVYVTVSTPPVAGAAPVSFNVCSGIQASITNLSFGAVSWNWTWSDGQKVSGNNGNRMFRDTGLYGVKQVVKNADGCVDSFQKPAFIRVHGQPVADFSWNPLNPTSLNPLTNFTDLSKYAQTYYWEFGDGGGSSDANPQHSYSDTGTYLVRLIVRNSVGCADTMDKPLLVRDLFMLSVPNSFSPNGDGLNDVYKPTVIGHKWMRFEIYNRWGALMFRGDEQHAWDGTFEGKPALQGIYAVKVFVKDWENKTHFDRETINLLR
ncbi:MAG: M4 family metallopeptidase [Bacteroidota bacterium]